MELLLGPLLQQAGPFVIAAVVPVIVGGFRKLWPQVPTVVLPIAAAVLGPVLDFAITSLTSIPSTGILSVVLGLAGVGLREVKDQVMKVVNGTA